MERTLFLLIFATIFFILGDALGTDSVIEAAKKVFTHIRNL